MKKIVDYFTERFKNFDRDEWLIVAGVFLTLVLLLWFSIGMSVSIAKGYTLFGDTSYTGDDAELVGPTSSDVAVLTLFWILAVAMLALFVYRFFFRPIAKEKASHKEIIDGKTYVIKDEKTTSGGERKKKRMTAERLQNDLTGTLRECDFVRYVKWDDEISFYVVADNEKDERDDDDCCERLNGHLFKIVFFKTADFSVKGEEADFYRQEKLEIADGHLFLQLEGSSFDGTKSEVTLAFSFERFQVEDLGKIQGPDA